MNMKVLGWALTPLLLVAIPAISQRSGDELRMPELHNVMRVTLAPSYSCRSGEEFRKGYANTALFLSSFSRNRNSPELLFNGACNSTDYFAAQTSGDDLDAITDYGDVPLTELAAENFFSPKRRANSIATFADRAKVVAGHTYGVLINKSGVRGFFYLKVLAYVPNQRVDLEYAVMEYQVLSVAVQSPGFSWDQKNSR